jgi:hypothetical protein
MKRVKGRVGICAMDTSKREKLSIFCKENGIIGGEATDLFSLITANREDHKPESIAEINQTCKIWQVD